MPGVPDGWTFSHAPNFAVLAKIVVPAAPNIAHVLTHISAKQGNNQQAAVALASVIVLDGAVQIFKYPCIVTGAGANVDSENTADVDVQLASTPGNSMTIQFDNPPPAGYYEALVVNGHDV